MPNLDGSIAHEDFPIGALLMDGNQIFKIIKMPGDDTKKIKKQIANFGIDIIAKSSDNRFLININQSLKVDNLNFTASLPAFKSYIRPYFFKGTSDDLENLVSLMCENVYKQDSDNLLIINDFVGFYEPEDKSIAFWIFKDRIFITHKNGERLLIPESISISEQKVIRVDEKWISVDQSGINKSLIPVFFEPGDYTLEQFLTEWLAQLKNKTILYSLLGWFIATLYIKTVEKLRGTENFPFYLITAGTEVGKTAFLGNAIHAMGFSYIGENYAASVTRFVETVEFSRVSHLPIWRDEYKNEKYALDKEGFMRSVYTRSGASRGQQDLKTRSFPPRATLLLSGEDFTEDPALLRRFIRMRLAKADKVSRSEHEQNTKNALKNFGKALPLILSAKFDEEVFLDIFNNHELTKDSEWKDELMCYAAIGAIFGKEEALKAIELANSHHQSTKKDIINQNQVTAEDFFSSIDSYFIEKGWYDSLYNARPKVLDYFYALNNKDTIYIKFTALHQLMMKNRGRDEYRWSKSALGQLIQEAYSAKVESRYFREESARVMIIEGVSGFADIAGDVFAKIWNVQQKWEDKENGGGLPDL